MDNAAYTSIEFTEQTATLMVDLVDTSTNAWRGACTSTRRSKGSIGSSDKLAKALDKGFAKYPPSASAIAKKARALEKSSGSRIGFAFASAFATATPTSREA